jgi:hypothetical protein
MITMNALQIQHVWLHAGGPAKLKVVMSAIAMAESSGGKHLRGDCYPTQGCTSFGVFQIHTRNWYGQRVNVQPNGRPYNEHRLTHDHVYNAHAALNVYRSQGLNAWSTYDHGHGAYRAFLPAARSAAEREMRLAWREHRSHHHRQKVASIVHKHHHPPQHPVHHHASGTEAALSNFAISFAMACGLALCWNMFRLGCKLVEASVREELAARKRHYRRRRYREEAALKRRMMPRTRQNLILTTAT